MINITVFRDNEGFILGFEVKGHAGFAKRGKDIVCSAVSAIAYAGIGTLEQLMGINDYIIGDGYMKCFVPCDISNDKKDKVKIILETIVIGFRQIELSYKRYVRVLDEGGVFV